MITDLEQAIKIHLDNQRKFIDKHQHPLVTSNTQIHIRTIEQAPRTSKALEAKIASTKQSMRDCQLIEIREQY